MPNLIVKTRDGAQQIIDALAGQSVMEAIREAGIDELAAICSGRCSCGTCHVYVDYEFLYRLLPPLFIETELTNSSDHRRPNSRLACQIPCSDALDGMFVTIAP